MGFSYILFFEGCVYKCELGIFSVIYRHTVNEKGHKMTLNESTQYIRISYIVDVVLFVCINNETIFLYNLLQLFNNILRNDHILYIIFMIIFFALAQSSQGQIKVNDKI